MGCFKIEVRFIQVEIKLNLREFFSQKLDLNLIKWQFDWKQH